MEQWGGAPADRIGFGDVTKQLLKLAESMRRDLGDYDRVGKNMRFFDLDGPRRAEPPLPKPRKRAAKFKIFRPVR